MAEGLAVGREPALSGASPARQLRPDGRGRYVSGRLASFRRPAAPPYALQVDAALAGQPIGVLVDVATKVAAEVKAPELLDLVVQLGNTGVAGELKNLIFAAVGLKPEIIFTDAINNDIKMVKHEEICLVYDRPLSTNGLTWAELTTWWADREALGTATGREIWLSLYRRLEMSMGDNEFEKRIFNNYILRYASHGSGIPALIPQVYLHYDPYTRAQRGGEKQPLTRQRMDFLLLMPNPARIVVECDGIQHYADDNGVASTRKYAIMMAEDRALRLRGYEVYRFGGYELPDRPATDAMLTAFFDETVSEAHYLTRTSSSDHAAHSSAQSRITDVRNGIGGVPT